MAAFTMLSYPPPRRTQTLELSTELANRSNADIDPPGRFVPASRG
jgi:hypothetical protein